MSQDPECTCAGGKFGGSSFESTDLGMDNHYGEVSLIRCTRCRRLWLHYYYVNEAFSKSGRWYHGLVPSRLEGSITRDNALDVFGKLEWYWYGGSFYDGKIGRGQGPPNLFP